MSGFTDVAASAAEWAVTYAIHSSLLLGLSFVFTRRLIRDDAWRETIWRGALLGSVVTATLITMVAVEPVMGRVGIGGGSGAAVEPVGAVGPPRTASEAVSVDGRPAPGSPSQRPTGDDATTGIGRVPATTFLLVAWVATATLLLALLLTRNVRLFRRLRNRRSLTDGRLAAMAAELRRHAGVWRPVTLSISAACPGPIVVGGAEICLPPQFITDLDEDQQRAALAHEIAHIRRRDPLWQLATGILGAILFFQPLNALAQRRLREAAEHLCDDWAVRQTGTPLALGRCLTAVASWVSSEPPPNVHGTLAMAEGGSPLVHRVRRIAEGVPNSPALRLPAVLAVAALLGTTAIVAPAAVTRDAGSDAGTPSGAGEGAASPAGALPSAGGNPGSGQAGGTAAADMLETIRLLESLAMSDPSPRVRQEAAAELSDFDHPAAAVALMRIVRRASDPVVRAEAAQQLDEFPTGDVVAVLLETVFEDSVPGVRSNALDVLADFEMDAAGAALRTVARDHPIVELRRDAVTALSDRGGE